MTLNRRIFSGPYKILSSLFQISEGRNIEINHSDAMQNEIVSLFNSFRLVQFTEGIFIKFFVFRGICQKLQRHLNVMLTLLLAVRYAQQFRNIFLEQITGFGFVQNEVKPMVDALNRRRNFSELAGYSG